MFLGLLPFFLIVTWLMEPMPPCFRCHWVHQFVRYVSSFGGVSPGTWILEPVGALQTILTGQVATENLIPSVVTMLIFLVPILCLATYFADGLSGWNDN